MDAGVPDPIAIINRVLEMDRRGMLGDKKVMRPPVMAVNEKREEWVQTGRVQVPTVPVSKGRRSSQAEDALRRMKLQQPVDRLDSSSMVTSPTTEVRNEMRRLSVRLTSGEPAPRLDYHEYSDPTAHRLLESQQDLVSALRAPPPAATPRSHVSHPYREIHTPPTNPYPPPSEISRHVTTPPPTLTLPEPGFDTILRQLYDLSGVPAPHPPTHDFTLASQAFIDGQHFIEYRPDLVKDRYVSVVPYPVEGRGKLSPSLVVFEDSARRHIVERVSLCEVLAVEDGLGPDAFARNMLQNSKLRGPDGSNLEVGPAGAFTLRTITKVLHLCATSAEAHRQAKTFFATVIDANNRIRILLQGQ